jgi:serine phosphatase RsbU (regulator of sigma subunit)
VSAADVLAGAVESDRLARRLVLLGVTAIGLGDHHVTPVDPRMPGVEIHAQLLEGIFDNALLSRPPWAPWAEAGLLLLGGLALILAVPARRVWVSVAVFAVAVALVVGTGFGLYRRAGLLLDAASPALGLVVVFSAMLGVTLAEADTQRRVLRRQVQQEREAAARVAGELEAARRIQMGILPDARRTFPGEPRFELYAFLEPARLVGGDLYDFFRLGPERLFFLIGDVSGKGLPGALFMAVSKALCKSAALRSAGDLGAMLREANAEIARDNPETMFVTVSAGLLDVVTGRLEYVNAGHEAPYRLGADGRLRDQLDEGGGPPLAVLEEYPYAAVACQLEPGETLVMVTDGLAEALDPRGELYGRPRLEAVLAGLAPAGTAGTAAGVGEALRADVHRWVAGAERADDLAILVLRWMGPSGAAPSGR